MSTLKTLRQSKKLTQQEVAEAVGVSLRSYITYENDESKSDTLKYRFLLQEVEKLNPLDEEHGLLSFQDIVDTCAAVFADYSVDYCYLFGSYAKGTASETSDVDLLIATEVNGLQYFELTERLREELHKKVDLIDLKQLTGNEALLNEVLREGIKIYG